ncbi:hypothetical protein TTHERM_00925330 (macronuclear) [Tetrahymena thermophila SB210]|uniref:Uncharacterized protein n=1 Tax=Tetrahymena thermophila (strain SB210) TaxID=312017 RepID=Q22E25_TETTS|nr:hypothetical protein TTHERM_00925330 [Tetrahymena thermophila SB210]EAR83487.1 hypothetical protein TTHERM_00925330 [Tetrahymena thermophila SB210]|eukprot:XP_001031150.1 hypothetical protein TTHERM_00925330 [Tetrahymena thermophila SB210]
MININKQLNEWLSIQQNQKNDIGHNINFIKINKYKKQDVEDIFNFNIRILEIKTFNKCLESCQISFIYDIQSDLLKI